MDVATGSADLQPTGVSSDLGWARETDGHTPPSFPSAGAVASAASSSSTDRRDSTTSRGRGSAVGDVASVSVSATAVEVPAPQGATATATKAAQSLADGARAGPVADPSTSLRRQRNDVLLAQAKQPSQNKQGGRHGGRLESASTALSGSSAVGRPRHPPSTELPLRSSIFSEHLGRALDVSRLSHLCQQPRLRTCQVSESGCVRLSPVSQVSQGFKVKASVRCDRQCVQLLQLFCFVEFPYVGHGGSGGVLYLLSSLLISSSSESSVVFLRMHSDSILPPPTTLPLPLPYHY